MPLNGYVGQCIIANYQPGEGDAVQICVWNIRQVTSHNGLTIYAGAWRGLRDASNIYVATITMPSRIDPNSPEGLAFFEQNIWS